MAKKTAAKKTRNRAAQDATLINVRALKKRLDKLERDIEPMVLRAVQDEMWRLVRARK